MITDLSSAFLGRNTYRLTWASTLTDPTYYLYRDGVLVGQTATAAWVVTLGVGETPVFEVFDDAADEPTAAYPQYVSLGWYAAAGAASYRIEQKIGDNWTRRASVADQGQGYFLWRSGPLADDTTHLFRIIPVGSNGNDGTATAFSVLMVRIPDPPAPTVAYSAATGKLTVS